MFDIDDQEDWSLAVPGEYLIDLRVMGLKGGAGGVPAEELLLLTDLLHHGEHGLVVQVIEEPDVGLAGVLLEGYRVTIHNF